MPGPLVQALAFLYVVQPDIERYLSVNGLVLRVDDQQVGYVDAAGTDAVQDALVEATETANFYLFNKHTPSILATSNWINRKCTMLATYRVCTHRANPAPDVVVEDAAKAEEDLKAASKAGGVPGLPLRRILAPVMSNTRLDPRYAFRCIRVERQQSSQHNTAALGQNVDSLDANTFEL